MNELKGQPLSVENIMVSFIDVPNHVSVTIFLNGCNMKCPHCHNPNLHSYKPESSKDIMSIITMLNKYEELVDTVCILGGEPLMQDVVEIAKLIKEIKKLKLNVCLYTAYNKEDVPLEILDNIDMLKTGRYDMALEAGGFLASSNQKYYTKESGEWSQW
jgi:anaerobic ribonucleoside-triphosphate reductase activating protein